MTQYSIPCIYKKTANVVTSMHERVKRKGAGGELRMVAAGDVRDLSSSLSLCYPHIPHQLHG